VGIKVLAEVSIMSRPPEIDVLLLHNQVPPTEAQRVRLGDAIRDSQAAHILIELKYTETITEVTLKKAMGYDAFYRESKDLKESELQTFIVSSKTPSSGVIKDAGYKWSQKGVLRSSLPGFRTIPIISLNDLPNTPHNILFKIFASKRKQKIAAFDRIICSDRHLLGQKLEWQIAGLYRIMLDKEFAMTSELNTNDIEKLGRTYAKVLVNRLPVKDRLAGIPAAERMRDIPLAERLRDIPLAERMRDIPLAERLRDIPLVERMRGIPVAERFEGLSDEEILRFLEARRKKNRDR